MAPSRIKRFLPTCIPFMFRKSVKVEVLITSCPPIDAPPIFTRAKLAPPSIKRVPSTFILFIFRTLVKVDALISIWPLMLANSRSKSVNLAPSRMRRSRLTSILFISTVSAKEDPSKEIKWEVFRCAKEILDSNIDLFNHKWLERALNERSKGSLNHAPTIRTPLGVNSVRYGSCRRIVSKKIGRSIRPLGHFPGSLGSNLPL